MNQFDYVIAMERVSRITTVKASREEVNIAYKLILVEKRKLYALTEGFKLDDTIRSWSYLAAAINSHTGKNPLPKRYYKELGFMYGKIAYELVTHTVTDDILHIYRNPYGN